MIQFFDSDGLLSPQEKEELIKVVNGTVDPTEEVDDFIEINPEDLPSSLGKPFRYIFKLYILDIIHRIYLTNYKE